MRELLVAIVLIAALGSTANPGPKEDALQVLEQWTTAFTDADVDGIVKLFAPDALFWGANSKTVVTTPEEIRQYFERARFEYLPANPDPYKVLLGRLGAEAYDPTRGSVRTWLYQIARNAIIDTRRRAAVRPALALHEPRDEQDPEGL